MTPRSRVGLACAAVALASALAVLYARTGAVDIDRQQRTTAALHEMQRLDAEWNTDILRAHIGSAKSYDPLCVPVLRLRVLQTELAGELTHTRAAQPAFDRFEQAFVAKQAIVEQFKTHNAILRNSVIYFPPAITELKRDIDALRTLPSDTLAAFDDRLRTLLADVLRYNITPQDELAHQVEAMLVTLAAAKTQLPDALQETIDDLSSHARAIVHFRGLENATETQLRTTQTGPALRELEAAYERAFTEELHERQRYRGYLFFYAGLLLALLAYAAWRQRRSYRIIAMMNTRLQSANALLEQRVAERTAKLAAQAAQLEQLAQHDSLTGLINYRQLTHLLDHALVQASRRELVVAVMFIDLDGFKAVNDRFGHASGDEVLKQVALRVQRHLRQEDALARLGGDEFVILLEDVGGRDGVMRVAELVLQEVRGIDVVNGNAIDISASIGVASVRGEQGVAPDTAALLHHADQAMYAAKNAGKNKVVLSEHAQWQRAATASTASEAATP